MVVADPILIKSGRPGRLNAPNQSLFDQHAEGIINRLLRDRTDLGANLFGDYVHGAVRPARNSIQHGQTLGRNRNAVLTKEGGRIGHKIELLKIWSESRTF